MRYLSEDTLRAAIVMAIQMNPTDDIAAAIKTATDAMVTADRTLYAYRMESATQDQPAKTSAVTPPPLGQVWPGQGGVYLGLHPMGGYLIGAEKPLDSKYEFGGYGDSLEGYSDLDGAENTRKLLERGGHPAVIAASEYTADGHSDFYLASQREAAQRLVAAGTSADGDWEWTSTPYGSASARAVGFERGYVDVGSRGNEFRVRPFRRFIA